MSVGLRACVDGGPGGLAGIQPWVAVMPEPGTLALLAWALLDLAVRRREVRS